MDDKLHFKEFHQFMYGDTSDKRIWKDNDVIKEIIDWVNENNAEAINIIRKGFGDYILFFKFKK